jgi:hypothetical protein
VSHHLHMRLYVGLLSAISIVGTVFIFIPKILYEIAGPINNKFFLVVLRIWVLPFLISALYRISFWDKSVEKVHVLSEIHVL